MAATVCLKLLQGRFEVKENLFCSILLWCNFRLLGWFISCNFSSQVQQVCTLCDAQPLLQPSLAAAEP